MRPSTIASEPAGRLWLVLVALLLSGCARNPATGRLQLSLVSDGEAAAMGKKADGELVESIGIYEDAELGGYVAGLGKALAASSERPGLPWQFRVLDSPVVNAFALPGGYVYVTRGLLGHLSSEAELAGVLGHEIGHVTAKHGVNQLSKARVAQRSVGVFRVVDPNARHIGRIAQNTAGLVLLKYSRDDEIEADDLGLRYMARVGYPQGGMVEVLAVLAAVSKGDGRQLPSWLSTHPDPNLRRTRIARKVGAVERGDAWRTETYLRRISGLVFGEDPRQGFFHETTFYHPALGLRLELPEGWDVAHQREALVGISPDETSLLLMAPSEAENVDEAVSGFFEAAGIERGEPWTGDLGGFRVQAAAFSLTADSKLSGLVVFVDFEGRVIVMLALGPEQAWPEHAAAVSASFASFASIRSRQILAVEPMRVRITKVAQPTTLAKLSRVEPSSVPLSTLAVINAALPDEPLEAGRLVKRVVGFNPASGALPIGSATPRP